MSTTGSVALPASLPYQVRSRWGPRPAMLTAAVTASDLSRAYDRARGNLDRHGVHFLTAYVSGV